MKKQSQNNEELGPKFREALHLKKVGKQNGGGKRESSEASRED